MRSRGDGPTPRELLLRATALGGLLVAVGVAWLAALRSDAAAHAAVAVRWVDAPSAVARDSMAALRAAGRRLHWEAAVEPIAVMREAVREPGGRIRLSAVGDRPALVRDSLGWIDSVAAGGGSVDVSAPKGGLSLVAGGTAANAPPLRAAEAPRVIVVGRAGWETRFTVAALEESGWRVDARLALGREREVVQGERDPRRSRHGVAIVFDSAAVRRDAAALLRFVREGGGLVLAGEAASVTAAALRAQAGARVAALEPPETSTFDGHEATHALPLFALGDLRPDAVLLEDREGSGAVVARRVGRGRVIQFGYAETWRWRMQGEGRAVEEHRAYWSWLAGLAAPTDETDAEPGSLPFAARGAAPFAAMVHALGPPSPGEPRDAPRPALPAWLGLLILLAATLEWALRRRRGRP